MLDKMTLSLARAYYAQSGVEYDEDDIEVYSYGLQIFLSSVLEVLAVLIIGLCIGRFFETIAFFVSFISLRSGAGGYHAKTYLRCFFGLLVVYGLHIGVLIITPVSVSYYVPLLILTLSVFPILRYAPVADPNKPIGPIQRKAFRRRSLVMLLIQIVIILAGSAFGIATSHTGEVIPYILLSFAIGQLTASGSLIAAKIQNARGRANYDCQDEKG
jgi:accessory gene regulator B